MTDGISTQRESRRDVRVLAFYRLPESPTPAGPVAPEGLPEWKPVRAARPRFVGHVQPRVPGELGYCNARLASVRDAQAALAAAYAVNGFCYVFRHIGSPTLDPTLLEIVSSRRPAFPFCLCWETTSLNAGAGFGAEDPGRQRFYSKEECTELIRGLAQIFADGRYIRIGNRPLFVVSSPDPIPEVRTVASLWRDECVRAGLGNPYLACYGGAFGADPKLLGFDAIVECPPLGGFPKSRSDEVTPLDVELTGDVRSYRSYVAQMLSFPRPDHTVFRTVMTGWDETARSPEAPKIFVDGNPETFDYWAQLALEQTRLRFSDDERLLFVRAWNEWDAGCCLEPDATHGRRYLEALRTAVHRPPMDVPARPSWDRVRAWATGGGLSTKHLVRSNPVELERGSAPSVSVVMPAYNHERYVVTAINSILAQTHRDLEIVAVDDGSRDATGALLDDCAVRCRSHALTVVHQSNAGAHEAINHGIALARGDVIAIINSDDRYAPTRLERLLAEMDRRGAGFAFSRTLYIDDDGRPVADTDPYVSHIRRAIAAAAEAPDLLFTLVYSNIAVSTGNFVFRRQLVEKIGGFCAMRVCHDWDFLLAASYETPLVFIDEPLYEYRLHESNTVASARAKGPIEVEQLLARFFERLREHPIARDAELLSAFIAHLRSLGMGGYLPRNWIVSG
ncbi:MAG TPA: glycoside hydrolase family 99-like domain-containing protein [Casimicrobiaceae bacterium]|jgi:glycosyltransferase involved in cell wall biosynthesis|nr:glycoside hydrolase family 99-like domain-containing protein [Casimicrobiaceae bacterium]